VREGWPTRNLGDICDVVGGGTPPKDNPAFYSGKIPWATVRDMRQDVIAETECRITKEAVQSSATNIIPAGNVVIATRVGLGKVCLLANDTAINQDLRGIIPRETKTLSVRFLFWWLKTMTDVIIAEGTGATVQGVKLPFVKSLRIPVPPLPEQQRIVSLLDEAFVGLATAKANAEKNLHNARAIFESHLQSVFTQRGKGWVEKRLGDLCTFSSGGTPPKNNSDYWSGKIPWVSGRDMKSTRLSDSLLHISKSAVAESSTRMAPAGALLVLVRGMGLAHGAQIAELMVPCAFNQDIRGIHPNPGLIPRFLLFALRDRINSGDTVLSHAAHGTLKIDSDAMQKVMIPLPPFEQQQRIVAAIDALWDETQRLARLYEQKLAALDSLKKSLLHQAFSGELDIKAA